MGKPERADLDRLRDARRHPDDLHPAGREGRRRAAQRRVREDRERQGPGEGADEELSLVPPLQGEGGRARSARSGGGALCEPQRFALLAPTLTLPRKRGRACASRLVAGFLAVEDALERLEVPDRGL